MTTALSRIAVPSAQEPTRVKLPATALRKESWHVLDRASALAINAAIAAERPLLLRGEPGTGKSQLARAAAVALQRRFLLYPVDARTEARDLLYTVDAVSRLAHAQLAGAAKVSRATALRELDVMKFVHPGMLWWAYDRDHAKTQAIEAKCAPPDGAEEDGEGVVLLIDEIDKADPSVPNGLLDAFGGGRFSVEGRATVEAKAPFPLVVLTTNEERALPDAFVRRCLVHQIELPMIPKELTRLPDDPAGAPLEIAPFVDALVLRGKANITKCDETVFRHAAWLIARDRVALRAQGVCLPGVAEYIDLLRAVTTLETDASKQIALLSELDKLATRKHPQDRG